MPHEFLERTLYGTRFDAEHCFHKRKCAEIIQKEYRARGYSTQELRLIKLVKGATLLRLRELGGLPSWTSRKSQYTPWRTAEMLMLPEYIIDYSDFRRIGNIKTNRGVKIFVWNKGFYPAFKEFFLQLEEGERNTVESTAIEIEKILKNGCVFGLATRWSRAGIIEIEKSLKSGDVFGPSTRWTGPDFDDLRKLVRRMMKVFDGWSTPPSPQKQKWGW